MASKTQKDNVRGGRYTLKGKTPEFKSPQANFIIKAIRASANGLTVQELAERAKKAGQKVFPCHQPYDRAVSFYTSMGSVDGWLTRTGGPQLVAGKGGKKKAGKPAKKQVRKAVKRAARKSKASPTDATEAAA